MAILPPRWWEDIENRWDKGVGKESLMKRGICFGVLRKEMGTMRKMSSVCLGILASPFPLLPLSLFWAQTERGVRQEIKEWCSLNSMCDAEHNQGCFGVWGQEITQNQGEAKGTFFPWPLLSDCQRPRSSALRYLGSRTVICRGGLCLEEQHIPFQRRQMPTQWRDPLARWLQRKINGLVPEYKWKAFGD